METGVLMHQSFVSTAPPPTGMARIKTFHFSEPWYKPRSVETTLLLALLYTTENFTGVTVSMLYPRHFPLHCRDNQKVIALHLSLAIPLLSP